MKSINELMEGLIEAIDGLTAAMIANGGATQGEEAGKNPTRRGRGKATDTSADATGQNSGGDTGSGAPSGTGEPKAVVDAGTGQTVVVGGDAPKVDRAAVKAKGVKLTQLQGGNDKLKELLKKHSPADTAEVKFGTVPDEAMPAFEADIDAAIDELGALAD